jgi:DNA invertase Pin-like site-specific DNA recombinase
MRVGYARTSTIEQQAGYDAQLRDLKTAGCEKVFGEQLSSVDAKRPQLEAALAFVREGDTFVITKIDRLARSIRHLCEIADVLEKKGVALQVLNPSMDTSTPAGRLTFGIFGVVAQFEREIMLERQKEGVQRAKAEGRYRGRAPTARAHTANVVALSAQGLGHAAIAKQVGISRPSVWRILNEKGKPDQ